MGRGSDDEFPDRIGGQRHFLGRFGEKLLDRLAKGVSVDVDGATRFVVIDSVEIRGSTALEEIAIRFHLDDNQPPPDRLPAWRAPASRGEVSQLAPTASPGGSTALWFTFSSDISVDENLGDLTEFLQQFAARADQPPK